MEFALSEEQSELASIIRALLERHADSRAVRQAADSERGYDNALWRLLCEQVGVAGLAIPEEHGGAGFSLFESLLVLEELGRSLAPSPLLSTLVTSEALLAGADEEARARLLPRLAAGEVGAFADGGSARLVLDGDRATVLVVATGDGLFEVDPATAERSWTPSMDQTIRLADVSVDLARATRIARDAAPARERAALVGSVGVAALQTGAATRALDMTVAYSREREQFGRPIGSFQALKHRMADMLVEVETSRSASRAASYAVASGAENATELTHVAKAWCGDALTHVAAETVQLHGGIAITWEHDAQLVLKRAHALGELFGSAHEHRAALEL
ncbi:acyl-CoA dehydrogenase family protein [Nocardioides koreensis]|uniref:Acyl-CoA dehydrogenase family protein n=1 Tax=Nocardioides koreensis TaxID=433651 RepID=A0ABN3A4W6_9ACTN